MILKTDCRNFPGDRPCVYNKKQGIMCNNCNYYSPVNFKILIIKLDALGDVLRTTSILHAVKDKYPESHITWITKNISKDIFVNNNLVDEVLIYESQDLTSRLLIEKYDFVIHPDASPISAALASIVKTEKRAGFYLNEKGKVIPANKDAIEWLEMGAFDQLKRENTKTYQEILHEIAGLPYNKGKIIINLTADEKEFKNRFYVKNNLSRFKILLGLNTGSSKRWKLKQLDEVKFKELIIKLSSIKDVGLILFGGENESERNKALKEAFPNVIDTGVNNSLRQFFALMDLSDVVLTGDTLALHVAAALDKRTVCFFGPTSYNEIEDYGIIRKVHSDLDCLVCYKNECDFIPNCMQSIETNTLYEMIMQEIEAKFSTVKS